MDLSKPINIGLLSSFKWSKFCKFFQDSASRDISVLKAKNNLRKGDARGRSTNYYLVD